MARKPRIEYPGAVYHLIGRGNYPKALFEQEGAGEAFERAIGETSVRCGWLVHAYVLMSNHYHLVAETPTGNLIEGMRWLQGETALEGTAFSNGSMIKSQFLSSPRYVTPI